MSTDNAWLLKTIEAKSDQLNACDLLGGPITVTVQGVKKMSAEQPVAIEIGDGRQPFKPCKSMRRVLIACWGVSGWVGRSMTLYCDTDVKWAGERIGGIRISHLSHISGPTEVPLTVSKGKSQLWKVEPLKMVEKPSESVETRIAKVLSAIELAKNADDLATVMRKAKQLYDTLTIEQQAQIDNAKLAKGF